MAQKRVLFVDDEPGIRQTLPAILNRHGFDVTVASRVDEALTAITSSTFDVLVSDLHIGEPGDGFVVVSAMRRTQPKCVTLILTGFPGFETALEAIRNQVDDYLIKPTPAPQLVRVIEQKLTSRKSGVATANKRLAEILRQNMFEITQRALRDMKADAALRQLPLQDEERIEHIPQLLTELAEMLDMCTGERTPNLTVGGAHARGMKRYEQGYTIPLIATYLRVVERAIYDVIHENLLSLNLSYFMVDLKCLNDCLGVALEHSLKGYLEAEQHRAPRRTSGRD